MSATSPGKRTMQLNGSSSALRLVVASLTEALRKAHFIYLYSSLSLPLPSLYVGVEVGVTQHVVLAFSTRK